MKYRSFGKMCTLLMCIAACTAGCASKEGEAVTEEIVTEIQATETGTEEVIEQTEATEMTEVTETEGVETEVIEAVGTEVTEVEKENKPWDPYSLTLVDGYVTFGSYEQDNNLANGKEPIEWRVVDSKDGNIMLISEYVLDTRTYHIDDSPLTWETAEIRQWLNTEFFAEAFSEDEQGYVLTTLVQTADQENLYNTKGGNATEDKVFLLSTEEAKDYLVKRYASGIVPTARAQRDGGTEAWLRSPGDLQNTVQVLLEDGSIHSGGYYAGQIRLGVRPAIWITPNASVLAQMDAAGIELPESKVVERDIQVGDYVRIGTYEQNNIIADGVEPIEWQILDIKDDKALLLSKYILDAQRYSSDEYVSDWKSSELRDWMAGEFYNTAFTEEEKEYIVLTKLSSEVFGLGNDHIFVLSVEQAKTYFDGKYNTEKRALEWAFDGSIAEETAYVKAYVETLPEKTLGYSTNYWWTRDLGREIGIGDANGQWRRYHTVAVYDTTLDFQPMEILGVRPAMWVELSALDAGVLITGENSETTGDIEDAITFGADGYVTFGSFEQDNDTSNGAEPIEWMILEQTENELLLMSRYGLVTKDFHEDYSVKESDIDVITWETSTIRAWLNNEFYNSAFSEGEKAHLCINDTVTSRYDITIDAMAEVTVQDYVYILNYSEASAYNVKKERFKPTAYALSQGPTNLGPNGDAPRLVREEMYVSGDYTVQRIISYHGSDDYFYLGGSHPVVCPVIKVRIN